MAKKEGKIRRLYKVFVSSTYRDNKDRRKLVQEAISRAGMVWHGMEIFTAGAEPAKEECLRLVKEADLFLGIIARRYGWEPDGKKSISEMEYDAAKSSKIDRRMFLIDPDTQFIEQDFDLDRDRWRKQEKLELFINRFSKDQMPAVFKEKTLHGIVIQSLNEWKEKHEQRPSIDNVVITEPDQPVSSLDKAIKKYREKIESLHRELPVAGFITQLTVPINVEEIFVPLRAIIDLRGVHENGRFMDASHADKLLGDCESNLEISLLEAFRQTGKRNQRGIVILGDPGSGKTTHLKRLLLYCLKENPEKFYLKADMLPVFLPLRELDNLNEGIDAFIQKQLSSVHLDTPPGFGKDLLERGNLIFLFDGLDEVADLKQREKVAKWIVDAVACHPTCYFVVTCRFAGYSETVRLSAQFLQMHIRPFSAEQVEDFVSKWYKIVETGLAKDFDQAKGIAIEKAENLLFKLKEPDFRAQRIYGLTHNPLLLANICLVHRQRGTLPAKRGKLYEECIELLLEKWREAKHISVSVTAEDGRRALQPAAYWLHSENGRTRATVNELTPHIEPALKSIKWKKGSVQDFLNAIRDESGLLTGWDQENYGFMHLEFQEYLAAREIRNIAFKDKGVLTDLAAKFGNSWWQEVSLLMLSMEEPSMFEPYMRELVKLQAFVDFPNLVDASIEDAAEISLKPFIEILNQKPGKDTGLWNRQFAALRVLTREDVDQVNVIKSSLINHPLPEIRNWINARFTADSFGSSDIVTAKHVGYKLIKIPGGKFMMGSPESEQGRFKNEGPLHEVSVSDFYMGIYPITNREYELFLKETPGKKEPEYWGDRRFNHLEQPLVGVSWHDAVEYASWAGMRLPTESEWEYACRANSDSRFYTGENDVDLDKAGWYCENSKEQSHPVGEKEPNSFGLYDMHGNVWEWVEDDWHASYKGAPKDGRAWIDNINKRGSFRVLRGGSWASVAGGCRSAYRFRSSPVNRDFNFGFRVVLPRSAEKVGR